MIILSFLPCVSAALRCLLYLSSTYIAISMYCGGVGILRGKVIGTCHFEENWGHNSVSLFEKWDPYFRTDPKSAELQIKKAH